MKVGIVRFPGSNCDADAWHAVVDHLHLEAVYLWHKQTSLEDCDLVILPGGFSYGDYLRPGAIARFSPVMSAVVAHAERGGPVLAICNGFQIACEAGLLPGALLRNASQRFVCDTVHLQVVRTDSIFTRRYAPGQIVRIPIAHGDGRYTADADTLHRLEENGQVVFRYVDAHGDASAAANPNGAMHHIAGIVSANGNVLGMMPHPERAMDELLGSADGLPLFESLLTAVAA